MTNETTMNHTAVEKVWNRYFILLFSICVCSGICMQIFNSIAILYVKSLGGSTAIAGIVVAMATLTSVIGAFFFGRLIDMKGRQQFILWGLIFMVMAVVAFKLLPFLAILPILSLVQGAGNTASMIGMSAAVTDVVPKDRLGEGVGYFGLTQALTTAIGPSLGIALISENRFDSVFYVAATVAGLGIICALFCDYEKKGFGSFQKIQTVKESSEAGEAAESGKEYAGIRKYIEVGALPAFITQFLLFVSCTFNLSYIGFFAKDQGIENVWAFFTMSAIGMLIARLFTSRLVDSVAPLKLLVPGLLIGGSSYIVLIFTPQFNQLIGASGMLYGLSLGIVTPVLNALAIWNSPENRRGAASATYSLSVTMGIGIGGLLLGILIDLIGFQFTLLACVGLVGLSILCSVYFFREKG
ncbi:MFS transporter [Anaerobium acetethylicum]|uniref:Predicted arabinose efflux permease, MFS family n=1 Tax=Anaerobium acetethylicum TaxID=1619234 RepID=A0A1D3TWE7_9FIRM|nr:MFS transporter [Anaerobium acetethylicum]SCP98552.1 Predicted arabinose efflux permease, MFS family [Anaerobium acetethylicum]